MSDKTTTRIATEATQSEKPTSANFKQNPTEDVTQTPVNIDLSNPTNLSLVIKEEETLKKTTITPQAESLINEWAAKFNLENMSKANLGKEFTINVQPDLRFITTLITNEVTAIISAIDIKPHMNISIFSICQYCFELYIASILIWDLNHPTTTRQNRPYKTESQRRYFINKLKKAIVPHFLEDVIQALTPITDTHNLKLDFVPSFSTATFKHDIGRIFTSTILTHMHNTLIQERANQDPIVLLNSVLNKNVLVLDGTDYTVSNLIGGPYTMLEARRQMENWYYETMTGLYSPATFRANLQRNSLMEYQTTVLNTTALDMNYYDFMFGYNDSNIYNKIKLIDGMQELIKANPNIGSTTLEDLMNNAENKQLPSHMINDLPIATWHKFVSTSSLPPDTKATLVDIPTTYTDGHLFSNYTAGDTKIAFPKTDPLPEPNLFYMTKGPKDNKTNQHTFIVPDHFKDPPHDVLLFQPYETLLTPARATVCNGILIDNPTLTGYTLPLPNNKQPLALANSDFRYGSIDTDLVIPMTLVNTATHRAQIEPMPYSISEQPASLILQTLEHNYLPVYNATNVHPVTAPLPGLHHFVTNQIDVTPSIFSPTSNSKASDKERVYLWSSFRPRIEVNERTHKTYFYYTLRPIFGTRIPVTRIKAPQLLIPS